MDPYRRSGLVEAPSTPPIALHDFLGQKAPSLIVSYHYTYDAMSRSTEGEEPSRSEGVMSTQQERLISSLDQNGLSSRPDSPSWRSSALSSRQNQPTPLEQSAENGDEGYHHRQQQQSAEGHLEEPSRHLSSLSLPVGPGPSNWQDWRRQLSSSREDSAKAAYWIRGWSMSVSEYGAEAFCGCGDSLVVPEMSSPSVTTSAATNKTFRVKMKGLTRGIRNRRASSSYSHKQGQKANGKGEVATSVAADPKEKALPPTPVVCPSCGRPFIPATEPDDDWGDDETSKSSGLPGWVKGVLKRFPGHGHEQNDGSTTDLASGLVNLGRTNVVSEGGARKAPAPLPGTLKTGPRREGDHPLAEYLASDEDDNGEVDPDQLSSSSDAKGKVDRAIAERKARLRRAQMLLAKTRPTTDAARGEDGG